MPEELLQLRLVTSRLQLIQDLCKAIVAHLGEGLRRQIGVWISEGTGRIWADTRDFKIEPRSIRVALDAFHDLCLRKGPKA